MKKRTKLHHKSDPPFNPECKAVVPLASFIDDDDTNDVTDTKGGRYISETSAEGQQYDRRVIERCGQPLFVLVETLDCVASSECVACSHKICTGETLHANSKPNVRPEMCPRASIKPTEKSSPLSLGLYPAGSRVLTIGDGDLSFSLALVEFLGADKVVATTYEPRESIASSYPETGRKNLTELQRRQVLVFHGVDANDLESTFQLWGQRKFDFIVFNFPCIATEVAGEDGQSEQMATNQLLLTRFGNGAAALLAVNGSVHVSHKTKAAFKNWQVAKFVCEESGLSAVGAVVFDRCAYPGYINRKARDRKSFPATDAVTFVFKKEGNNEQLMAPSEEDDIQHNETLQTYVQRIKESRSIVVPVTNNLMNAVKLSLIQLPMSTRKM